MMSLFSDDGSLKFDHSYRLSKSVSLNLLLISIFFFFRLLYCFLSLPQPIDEFVFYLLMWGDDSGCKFSTLLNLVYMYIGVKNCV